MVRYAADPPEPEPPPTTKAQQIISAIAEDLTQTPTNNMSHTIIDELQPSFNAPCHNTDEITESLLHHLLDPKQHNHLTTI
jgi:hypothetical protein